jgi:hypothetical protein
MGVKFLAKFLFALLLGVSSGICQRALVNESGMIRAQIGMHSILQKWSQCMGHFVQYHPLTITSNGCETQSLMLREEHRLKAF